MSYSPSVPIFHWAVSPFLIIDTASHVLTWAASIFNFPFICLSPEQSPGDHPCLSITHSPDATGRVLCAGKTQKGITEFKATCLGLLSWDVAASCRSELTMPLLVMAQNHRLYITPNSSLQGMWIKHLLSPFPPNFVPLWLGTTWIALNRSPLELMQ